MTAISLHRDSAVKKNIPTWHIFVAFAASKVCLGWIYDTKILTADVIRGMANGSNLPPEISAVLSSPHVTLLHFAAVVFTFALGTCFLACCLQLTLLAFGQEVPVGRLFRAVLIASATFIAASALRAAQLLSTGSDFSSKDVLRLPASLASVALPTSASHSDLYALLSTINVFEFIWCVLLVVQLSRVMRRNVAVIVVGVVWVALMASKWALITYVPRLLL